MVADICHENGVACLMNGDVTTREEGLRLAEEFGADGAMIATAAEKNPSCFRSEADGGVAPWQEVVESYVKTALDVDNRFGNTKFLLAQMVPGKSQHYQPISQCKSYVKTCETLGLDKYVEQAKEVDSRCGLDQPPMGKAAKKKAKNSASALAAGGQMARQRNGEGERRKKALSERGPSTRTKPSEPAAIASAV